MLPCDCEQQPAFIELSAIDADEEADFFTGFVVGPWRGAYRLYRCPACQQLWLVDDKSRYGFVAKVDSADALETFDPDRARRDRPLPSLGSDDPSTCMIPGCDRPRLDGKAFCAEHLATA